MVQSTARGATTRHANMALRRERILDTAREIIAASGFDALNVRELAERADVTVPTIYNLVGNKSALVAQLFDDSITPFEHLDFLGASADPVDAPEAFYAAVVETMRDDENYHRAEFLAREHLCETGDALGVAVHERILGIAIDACEQMREAGLVAGRISVRQLGAQIESCFRLHYHDWAHRVIDVDTFEQRVLSGTYVCLAADATPEYHARFVDKLRALEDRAPVVDLARAAGEK